MAVPFTIEGDSEDHSYMRIENLLKELLTLLRWMPWTTVTEMPTAAAVVVQQRRQTAGSRQQTARGLAHHHHRLAAAAAAAAAATATHNRPEEQQQQQPLPDLITSTMSAIPYPPPPPQLQSSADEKPTKKIVLEVELCSECYYDHQKYKVIAASRRNKSSDGPLSRRHRSAGIAYSRSFDNDGEESVVIVQKSYVKQRIMSLLTPSKIDSSILTAVFVIIGWKMFIKQ